MRTIGLMLVCGVLLAGPLLAAVQSEPDPAALDVAVDPNAPVVDPNAPVTRTIDVTAEVSPFAGVPVADVAPTVDEALPQATPAARDKLPPGPPTRWP